MWGLRNYGKETECIWDGDENCTHEWVSYKSSPRGGKSNPERPTNVGSNRSEQEEDSSQRFGIESNFCSRCPAWKGQLGSEPHFRLYLSHILQIFLEAKRVLKHSGSIYVNIGDTYAGSNSYALPPEQMGLQGHLDTNYPDKSRPTGKVEGVRNKSLCLIPQRFATMMVDNGFLCRNEIIWFKRNCLPVSATDRYTVDFEPFFFFTKEPNYYFEQQFEANKITSGERWGKFTNIKNFGKEMISGGGFKPMTKEEHDERYSKNGRNKRTVWDVVTKGESFAHFAIFPEELVTTPILACCPIEICTQCNTPREKIYETNNPSNGVQPRDELDKAREESTGYKSNKLHRNGRGVYGTKVFKGYTDCGCGKPFNAGIVMDLFGGSGTCAVVAERLKRNWILLEANPEYAKLAERRIKSKGDIELMNVLEEVEKGEQNTL